MTIRDQCRRADINSKSLLLQIVRQPDEESMRQMATQVIARGMTRDDARQIRKEVQNEKKEHIPPYVYRYASPGDQFRLELRFKRSKVPHEEVCAALKAAVTHLEKLSEEAAESDKP